VHIIWHHTIFRATPLAQPNPLDTALTNLAGEISLNRPFASLKEAALLSLVWTYERLEQAGRAFFPRFGITEAQFNVLMILDDYRGRTFRQHELAEILVVNRASAGSVLERMERSGWIARAPDPEDRRAMRISMTRAGSAKLEEVRGPYYRLMSRIFKHEDERELRNLVFFCDRLRRGLARFESQPHLSTKE
jgi:DNA-binding MarR family transcriptional regulator